MFERFRQRFPRRPDVMPPVPEEAPRLEATVSRQTTFTEILNDKQPPDAILTAPLHVVSRETGDGREYAAVINSSLSGEQLYNFLRKASPGDPRPGRLDVYNDWNLLTDPKKTGQYRDRLLSLHTQLGESWDAFATHTPAFIAAMQDRTVDQFPLTVPSPYLTDRQAKIRLEFLLRYDRTKVAESFYGLTADYTRADLLSLFPEIGVNLSRDQHGHVNTSSAKDLQKKFLGRIKYSSHSYARFLSTPLGKALYADQWNNFHPANISLPDGSTIQLNYEGKHLPENLLEHVVQGKGESEGQQATYTAVFDQEGAFHFQRTHLLAKSDAISPVLHWKTSPDSPTGRELITDNDMTQQLLGGIKAPLASGHQAHDSFLGLLVLSYLTKDIRDKWPTRMKLQGSNYGQEIGPAQIPVLAHMHHRTLERSPVLDALEAFATA